ncbi:hypothetical protein [Salinimonas chungwhensis]|uniref:hypothetical protein n=1 Tax=Salinimonas chungwhensis TaxID=265425 RepID=UPI00037C221F|nr:hypothetical protein [Salinimonas chungwhensis]
MLVRGYTLTGMLISLAIGMILLSAAASFVVKLTLHQLSAIQRLDLINQLSRLAFLVSTQVRRAGYDAKAMEYFLAGQPRSVSPFFPAYSLSAHPDEPADSCILFHFDKNHNGIVDTHPSSEHFGYRLKDGALESRVAGKQCHEPGWHDVSEPDYYKITVFRIELITTTDERTLLKIHISAALKDDEEQTAALQWPVILRNN